ncbi:MAG: IS5 family transposase [Clostridia bacterium]
MRALDPEVVAPVWAAVQALIPVPVDHHPLGCHRPRIPDRDCFQVMLVRLVTGCSWEDAERLCDRKVSDTTVRTRRDAWVQAGVFDTLVEEALAAYDRIIGLDFSEVALDGSLHKAPTGGEGTGQNPTDRAKRGWKWSICTDRQGIPVGWAIDAANRHDLVLLEPTLAAAAARGLLSEIETLWLDRGYDAAAPLQRLAARGLDDIVVAKKRPRGTAEGKRPHALGLRWPVERTNAWLANFGQLRRNTDRRVRDRLAQVALAVTFILTAKLIDWRKRWCPDCRPIR